MCMCDSLATYLHTWKYFEHDQIVVRSMTQRLTVVPACSPGARQIDSHIVSTRNHLSHSTFDPIQAISSIKPILRIGEGITYVTNLVTNKDASVCIGVLQKAVSSNCND